MAVVVESKALGWPFFGWWMLAFLGFPLGGLPAHAGLTVDDALTGAIAGAVAGGAIGAAQWLVLRRYLKVGVEWVAATSLAMALGLAVGAFLTDAETEIEDLLMSGAYTGLAVGLAQWALLKGKVQAAFLWVPVIVAAWPLGWTVTWAFGIDVEARYAVFGSSGALVFSATTGAVMWFLLRSAERTTLELSAK
jgi:hypothetical protein